MVVTSKKMKVTVSGGFMQQTFYFDRTRYEQVLALLEKKLPLESTLDIK